MASKVGCVLIERKGHAAPVSLVEKIRAQNSTVMGMALPAEGSNEIMLDTFREVPTAQEWHALRSSMNEADMISWWGSSQGGFADNDVQPHVLLANGDGKPCVVVASEGNFLPHAKPKETMSDEYRLHEAMRSMVEGVVEQTGGDMSAVAKQLNGSLFKGWWGAQSADRGVSIIMLGTGEIIVLEKGNDKGMKSDAFEVSNAYGWKPEVKAPTAQEKFAALKAQRNKANASASQVTVATATTATEKLSAAAQAAMLGKTAEEPVPGDGNLDDTLPEAPSQAVEMPGEEGADGLEYPPKDLLNVKKNAKNWSKLHNWYLRRHNGTLPGKIAELGLRKHWEKGEYQNLPGVPKGAPTWQHPKALAAAEKAAAEAGEKATKEQETIKSFADPRLQNAAKTGTTHIVKPTSQEMEKIIATANDPFMSPARKDKIVEQFIGRDTVLKAISYPDEEAMMSPTLLNRLDRPKADPLTVFGGVIKDYGDWRMTRTDTTELLVIDPAFGADIIHDLVYRNNLLTMQLTGKNAPTTAAELETGKSVVKSALELAKEKIARARKIA